MSAYVKQNKVYICMDKLPKRSVAQRTKTQWGRVINMDLAVVLLTIFPDSCSK